jgi:hypothetical protein
MAKKNLTIEEHMAKLKALGVTISTSGEANPVFRAIQDAADAAGIGYKNDEEKN